MNHLSSLNESQRDAATSINGPVLVLAGPGSGKTRVLTHRVAYLLQEGIDPFSILALTFTNKSAREMKERIIKITGSSARNIWMGTFHSIFARILRMEAEKIGYSKSFTIYDNTDSKSLLKSIIKNYAASKSILGVCLGMQAIAEVFGGTLRNLDTVYHGVATKVKVSKPDPIFKNLGDEFEVGRYHSWVVNAPLPECLIKTSEDTNGEVMSLRHKDYDVVGVQYHPESVLTPNGKLILENWLHSS